MDFKIVDRKGEEVSKMAADKSVFGIEPNSGIIRQAVLSEMTNMRQGTHSAKNRPNVNGGGKKPWKQKGRGVARAGTIRSPLWKGGGVVFGPTPHSYNHKLSKKGSRLARRSVLSNKAADGDIIVIDNLKLNSHKTSEFVSVLKSLNISQKKITLLTSDSENLNLDMSVGNLVNVNMIDAKNASTYDLIDCDILLIDKASVEVLTEILKV